MKKNHLSICGLLLIVMIALLAIGLTACAVPNSKIYKFSFTVASDIHVMSKDEIVDRQSEQFITYDLRYQKLIVVSEAVFISFIDDFIESDQKALLIAGDLTEQGSMLAHQAVTREFKRAEDAGKKVFVVPGNHDFTTAASIFDENGVHETAGTNKEEFAALYNDFGFSEALSRDTNTLSYTADIGGDYRLIAVDAVDFNETTNAKLPLLTEELKTWILNEVEKAVSAGKEPLFMCHYPIIPHTGGIMDELSDDLSKTTLAADMRERGLKFSFTGHLHSNDIVKASDEDGVSIYDIQTGSLISSPSPYRVFADKGDEIEIITRTVNELEEEDLLPTLNKAEKDEVLDDYQSYAKRQTMQDLVDYIKVAIRGLKTILLENGVPEATATRAITFLNEDILQSFFDMPLYKTEGKLSVESICEQYNIDLPETEMKNIFELAQFFMCGYMGGRENVKAGDPELTVLTYSIYSLFYIIAESDLYEILSEYDAGVRAVDLKTTMVDVLFTTGKLEVIPLVYSVLKMDIINEIIQNLAADAGNFGGVITDFYSKASNYDMATLKEKLSVLINTLAWGFIEEFRPLGINVASYIDVQNVSLDLGKFLNVDFPTLAGGLLLDKAPDDWNIIVNKKTSFLVVYE